MERECAPGRWLRLAQGDITEFPVDAIVNAANSELRGGGGVDGAIHEAGGPSLMQELRVIRQRGPCPTGSAVVTGAGDLPARYVFHAVGPVWSGGHRDEPALLASCYRTCLGLAEERSLESLSFPSISTGVYGYPIALAAPLALVTVAEHLQTRLGSVREVRFVLYDSGTHGAYAAALQALRP